MATIRQMVLDVLKPHEPPLVLIAHQIADIEGVSGVSAMLLAMDDEYRNVKFTIEGKDIDYETVTTVIEDRSGSVHSVDQVVCGEYVVESLPTPQD